MRRLSESEKTEIWDRFEAGESLRSISRLLRRPPSTIRSHVLTAGFRRPIPAEEWSPRWWGLRVRFHYPQGRRALLVEADELGSSAVSSSESLRQRTESCTDGAYLVFLVFQSLV